MAHFTSDFDWVCCRLYGLTRDCLSDHLVSMLLPPLSFYLVRYKSTLLQAELCTQVFFSNGKKVELRYFLSGNYTPINSYISKRDQEKILRCKYLVLCFFETLCLLNVVSYFFTSQLPPVWKLHRTVIARQCIDIRCLNT